MLTNWITEKCVQAGCLRTSQFITKLVVWGHPVRHLTHDASDGEQFLQYIVTGDETFVHCVTLKNQYGVPDVERTILSNRKGIQRNAINEEVRVFCNHTGVRLTDLLVVTM